MTKAYTPSENPSKYAIAIIVTFVIALTFALLSFQISTRRSSYSLDIGDVATQDISAPRTVTYISGILTEQACKDAESIVSKVYLPADPSISREQAQHLRNTFQFITSVRGDQYSSELQKVDDINKIMFVRFDESTIDQVLNLSEDDWITLQAESNRVLEEVMRNSIRDNRVASELENIPTMIKFNLSAQISSLVNAITRKFIVPNSLYSEELTEKNKKEARESVQPRERTYVMNQTIIQRGQVVTDLVYEGLDQLGLVHSKDNRQRFISAFTITIALSLYFILFTLYDERIKRLSLREIILILVLYVLFLVVGRLFIPNRTIMPYIFPIQALGLSIACLFNQGMGAAISVIISILVPYDFSTPGNYSIYYLVTSLIGISILGKGRQISSFVSAGVLAGFVGIPLVIAYQYNSSAPEPDIVGLITLSGASLLNGLFSTALALILQYVCSGIIGTTTSMHLMEILRPDSALLQFLLRAAPGTYQHSLMVANIAEQAAKDIGADPLLVRAGAMYHDSGKALNPSFFVENQIAGNLNLHEDISPQQSAASIIQHVYDGITLIKKYHLPDSMIDFVTQHHGTNITRFQYTQALEKQSRESVNIQDFTYPGPRPQSKETALVMLADTCEARARAEKPANDLAIDEMVRSVFNYYSNSGQLDDTPLTLKDLTKIRESFTRVLRNTYHPRVKYPEPKKSADNSKDKENRDPSLQSASKDAKTNEMKEIAKQDQPIENAIKDEKG